MNNQDRRVLTTMDPATHVKLRLCAIASGETMSEYACRVIKSHFDGNSFAPTLSSSAMDIIGKEIDG